VELPLALIGARLGDIGDGCVERVTLWGFKTLLLGLTWAFKRPAGAYPLSGH
jgi:hypothetical protein